MVDSAAHPQPAPVVLALLLILLGAAGWAEPATVVAVTDGDTVKVTLRGEVLKVRLSGIDAPEKDQWWGPQSSTALATRVLGQVVDLECLDTDKYGRTLGVVRLRGVDQGREQVQTGNAWAYRKYLLPGDELIRVEKLARDRGVGLWSSPPSLRVPPWEWRHRNDKKHRRKKRRRKR